MDYLAIVSVGFYPTPTPTASERMAYAVSYGLLGSLGAFVPFTGGGGMGLSMILDNYPPDD